MLNPAFPPFAYQRASDQLQAEPQHEPAAITPTIERWVLGMGVTAKIAGVKLEYLLAYSLSMYAAMIGHLASHGDDAWISLPLLVVSPDGKPPSWVEREWLALERLSDFEHSPPALVHHATRAKKRRLAPFMVAFNKSQPGRFSIEEKLYASRLQFGKLSITHGTGRLAVASDSLPMTHLAATLPRVRAAWRRLASGHRDESVLANVSPTEARKLVKEHGLQITKRAGLILNLPHPTPFDGAELDNKSITDQLFDMALRARQHKPAFVLRPPDSSQVVLQAQMKLRQQAVERVPEPLRSLIPPPERLLDMIALIVAMCPESEDLAFAVIDASKIARIVDFVSVKNHLDFIRRHFPADEKGLFEGDDRAIIHQLGDEPQKIREIQRNMKGVSAMACRTALDRAVAAGLVEETQLGRFTISAEGPPWLDAWTYHPPKPPAVPVPAPTVPKNPLLGPLGTLSPVSWLSSGWKI